MSFNYVLLYIFVVDVRQSLDTEHKQVGVYGGPYSHKKTFLYFLEQKGCQLIKILYLYASEAEFMINVAGECGRWEVGGGGGSETLSTILINHPHLCKTEVFTICTVSS